MLNKVVLVGRLTKEPELRKTNSGTSAVSFRLAVDRPYRKDQQKEADFPMIVAYGSTAEFLANHMIKGDLISVEGKLQTRIWDRPNDKQTLTEVIADHVEALSWKKKEIKEPTLAGTERFENADIRQSWSNNNAQDTLGVDTEELPFY